MEYTVNHYPEKHRFEVVEDGLTAYVEYRLRGDALDKTPSGVLILDRNT